MKKIIFEDSFFVADMMCFKGCGLDIEHALSNTLKQHTADVSNLEFMIDAEPEEVGIHRLIVAIESEDNFALDEASQRDLSAALKKSILSAGYTIVEQKADKFNHPSDWVNRANIIINLVSMLGIVTVSSLFPPSLFLTMTLTSLSLLTTGYTARNYLFNFVRNLRNRDLANMTTTVTLGCLLSMAHTLYHVFSMPLTVGLSMTFMSFMMPIMLIMLINGMDEIKRLVLHNAMKMQLVNMGNLFPHMQENYCCYALTCAEVQQVFVSCSEGVEWATELLSNTPHEMRRKNLLKKGMVIKVSPNQCFPVDCQIIQGSTLIDASNSTGNKQFKRCNDLVLAGAVNLGQEVIVYATQNSYQSEINKLLFRANRTYQKASEVSNQKFMYFYSGLILLGIIAAALTPLIFGVLTVSLLLQNITGILFAICPCTIAIAHQLPRLLSMYQRSKQGIILRDERLTMENEAIHTIIFDKTGTLTTGNSKVDRTEGEFEAGLWYRIYRLEQACGAEHPVAKAMIAYYEIYFPQRSINFGPNQAVSIDQANRGLTGCIEGKKIHLGTLAYLAEANIQNLPDALQMQKNFPQRFCSPVYVAEDGLFKGIIWIKHEIRENCLSTLKNLKDVGVELILLTGDSQLSAEGFNEAIGSLFEKKNIYAQKTPQEKENLAEQLIKKKKAEGKNPAGICGVGDNLNDALFVRKMTEEGGISFAMTSKDKAAHFTDIRLNGSAEYLLQHAKLNAFLKKNIFQNQSLLILGALAFLAFIIIFSVVGIAVSPLILMMIMLATTFSTLFNSYRVKLAVDDVFDKKQSWLSALVISDLSFSLLVGGSVLLIMCLLTATVATGVLCLPVITFSAGLTVAVSSICCVGACISLSLFFLFFFGHLFMDNYLIEQQETEKATILQVNEMQDSQAKNQGSEKTNVQLFSPHSSSASDGDAYISGIFNGPRLTNRHG